MPEKDTALMNGEVSKADRTRAWEARRAFYCTPQTLANDLRDGRADARRIVLLVVDEAHRATKDYAYCKVVRELDAGGGRYRVLALSATPGADTNKVQDVVRNLRVSRLEVRTHDDPSVAPYRNETLIDKVVVPLSPPLEALKAEFVDGVLTRVMRYAARYGGVPREANAARVTVASVLRWYTAFVEARAGEVGGVGSGGGARGGGSKAAKAAAAAAAAEMSSRVRTLPEQEYRNVVLSLRLLIQLAPALKELTTHGVRSFHTTLARIDTAGRGPPVGANASWAHSQLVASQAWVALIDRLQAMKDAPGGHPLHPKLAKLGEALAEHFARKAEAGVSTRAIVFTQTRSSVDEILRYIAEYHGDGSRSSNAGGGATIASYFGGASAAQPPAVAGAGAGASGAVTSSGPVLRAAAFVGQRAGADAMMAGGRGDGGDADDDDAGDDGDDAATDDEDDDVIAAAAAAIAAGDAGAEKLVLGARHGGATAGAAALFGALRGGRGGAKSGRGAMGRGGAFFSGGARSGGASASAASAGSTALRGQTQREQAATIEQFRRGAVNVLVATCIGEEGLDIGEVGLIVNFDTVASPGA